MLQSGWPDLVNGRQMGPDAQSISALLRRALQEGRSEDWAAFVRISSRPIRTSILRTLGYAAGAKELDDLSQETYLRLCHDDCRVLRTLADQPESHVCAFVATVAANVALDYVRKNSAQKRGPGEKLSEMKEDPIQPSTSYGGARWIQLRVLLRELSCAMESSATGINGQRDRSVFKLYFEDGLTAAAIAAIPEIGLSIKGVESTILRLVRSLQQTLGRPPAKRNH